MNVLILEKDGEKVIVSYHIKLTGMDSIPSNEEYHSEAWRMAVEEKVVELDSRDKYRFVILP